MAIKAMNTILRYTTGGDVTIGKLSNISCPEISADTIDVTNHDNTDGYREFIQGLRDGGEVSCEGQLDSADAGLALIYAHVNDDVNAGGVQGLEIEYIDGSVLAFNAVCTGFKPGDAPVEGVVSFSASYKITGKPTWTPAA